eukprot:TRINITY_DN27855_c0_g1_i1.p1 TRINITY_DN27855_c0_g1~~TRINITY_DN27855_c0_g1_i1.p1  ORF type:complete len:293 (+),score=116.70 TRINITY_DN27855_c0_g1_i1:56-880(+)
MADDAAVVCEKTGKKWYPLEKLNDKGGRDTHGSPLTDRDGRMLKPLQKGDRLQRELDTYAELRKGPLAPFLAGCYGTQEVGGQAYLELEDLTHGIDQPRAIMDIKIGRLTFEDDEDPDKIAKQLRKNPEGSTGALGFRLVGVSAGQYRLLPFELRARCPEGIGAQTPDEFIREGVMPLCYAGGDLPDAAAAKQSFSTAALREIIVELRRVLEVAEAGFGGQLRAASLFLARELKEGGRLRVRLIDLAHYSPASGVDENFTEGLRALVTCLEAVL